MAPLYDAVVIGSRVAGASTAIFLAQRGYQVLLVDRSRFPSPVISTHVFGDQEIYAKLGVLEQLEQTGAPPMTRMRVDAEGCILEAKLLLFERSIGVRREVMDTILVERATSYPNITFRPETAMVDLIRTGERVEGVVLRGKDGRTEEVRARVVIGADGRGSAVARAVQAPTYLSEDSVRLGYYAYFADLDPLPIPTVEWYWWWPDILFVTPCDGGLHTILVMSPQEEFPQWKADPEGTFHRHIQHIETLAPRLKGARQVGPVRGYGNLDSFLRQSWGEGWALVGDAGAHVHPVTGSGIDTAALCADLLAEALDQAFRGERPWAEALGAYQEKRDAKLRSQIQGALKTIRRGPIPQEGVGWFSLFCTLPGVVYDGATRGREVLELIMGKEKAAAGEPLVADYLAKRTAEPVAPVAAAALKEERA